MTELALYRKYRPRSFEEVLGQEHITQVLKKAVEQNSFVHAYLFAGSRGTGKTSIARILAKSIGCSDNDIYEIDAASNTGVDNIRELREAVNSLPFDSPYKVYIMDEVHMLSKGAFNAFLKILEEPPAHTVFVLATTEVEKLPDTIASRCQSFYFKKPTHKALKSVVLDIAAKEGIELDTASADLIALLGEGSFRDAQGILQKVVSAVSQKRFSHEEVARLVGAPKGETVNELLKAVQNKELERALQAVNSAVEENVDIKVFVKLVLRKMRAVLLMRHAPEMEENLKENFSDVDFEKIKELSAAQEPNINSLTLKRLLEMHSELGSAYIPQLPLELALIEILTD